MDGTNGAPISATVEDPHGQPGSNCPTVTLTIEAGPGEFPTGQSITFATKSDITIRDGTIPGSPTLLRFSAGSCVFSRGH